MQGQESVNMADVARAAGVSVGTVSRAIAGTKGVSAATRRRITELADHLGYVVSPEASRLAGGRTGRVGLVTPYVNTWFHSNMIAGIAETLTAAGIDVLLYPIAGAGERHRFFDQLPARRKVDAVIIIAAFPVTEPEWQRLDLMGVPVVVAGLNVPGRPSVGIDDDLAARQAVNHLLLLGHERIAMITGEDPEGYQYHSNVARLRGFRATMRDHGVTVDENLIIPVPWGIPGGARGMDTLLSAPQPPTAVFTHSDEVAFGALQSLRRAGIRTPDGMSIVSIDDHPMAETADLTTVHQSVTEQAVNAGHLCLDLLHDHHVEHKQIIIPTHLIIRRTTAPTRTPGAAQPQTLLTA
jgi:LacI family repressor for deo operon, udp, cdd, tsx, nupC, and nupG